MSGTRTLCDRCGVLLEPGVRFCPSCGSGVVAARPSSATTPLPAGGTRTALTPASVSRNKSQQMLEQLRDATLGDYEILAELGSGGMATVFLAHDLQLDRRVAIKLMHPALVSGDGMVERFILEARTAAGLSHANIIPIYAVRVEEELLFFVMKFVEGRPLDSIVKKEAPLPAEMVRQIVSQVAEALGYAHKRGVIHRDVKPANIMISTDGHPILTDFGIAKVADKQGLTMTGATIGTPTYMSPEQCNALPLTGASDQYSLGVMAYEMMTGRPPFDADSVMTIMFKHINEPVRPVLEQVQNCPPDLAAAIDRMLAKDPEERFPNIEDVARAIYAPTVTSENIVRTQLVQFAMAGSNREVLKRVSTPRSPIPSSLVRKGKTRVAEAPAASRRGISRPALFGGAGALVVTAVVLALVQPWKGSAVPGGAGPQVTDPAPAVANGAMIPPATAPAQEPADTQPAATGQAPPPAVPAPRAAPGVTATPQVPQVRSVAISGLTTLDAGGNSMLRAEPRDARGRSIAGSTVTWRSSAPDVVSVGPGGELLARRPGRATVTATVDGLSQGVTVTVNAAPPPEIVVERPPVRETTVTPPPAAQPAGPTAAELKEQVGSAIQAYASALEAGNIGRVRQIYPGMPSAREQQLRQALPAMENLRVRLAVGQVDIRDDNATARVTGSWVFQSGGRQNTLPADDTYTLERRGAGWVITDIR